MIRVLLTICAVFPFGLVPDPIVTAKGEPLRTFLTTAGDAATNIAMLGSRNNSNQPNVCPEIYSNGISVRCQGAELNAPVHFYVNSVPVHVEHHSPYYINANKYNYVFPWIDYYTLLEPDSDGLRPLEVQCAYKNRYGASESFIRKLVILKVGCGICADPILINVGGDEVGDFQADTNQYTNASEGNVRSTSSKVLQGTVYQIHAWVDGALVYRIPTDAGRVYEVRLHFAETDETAPNLRVIDVELNGETIESNLDVFARVGSNTPLIITRRNVMPVNGSIEVRITSTVEHPFLAGIEIKQEQCIPVVY